MRLVTIYLIHFTSLDTIPPGPRSTAVDTRCGPRVERDDLAQMGVIALGAWIFLA